MYLCLLDVFIYVITCLFGICVTFFCIYLDSSYHFIHEVRQHSEIIAGVSVHFSRTILNELKIESDAGVCEKSLTCKGFVICALAYSPTHRMNIHKECCQDSVLCVVPVAVGPLTYVHLNNTEP